MRTTYFQNNEIIADHNTTWWVKPNDFITLNGNKFSVVWVLIREGWRRVGLYPDWVENASKLR